MLHIDLSETQLTAYPNTPIIHISARISHAEGIVNDCKAYYGNNVEMDYYRDTDSDGHKIKLESSIRIIVSPEQIATGRLGKNLERFSTGILMLDEVNALATSAGTLRGTIRNLEMLFFTLKKLVRIVGPVICLDRDITLRSRCGTARSS